MTTPTPSEVMRAYAFDAVNHAREQYGFVLDYSEQSLELIDQIIWQRRGRESILAASLSVEAEENLWTFCKMLGGYLGEVVVRNIGAVSR